jgi:DNA/RNA-binding domain of Phe-tRNA-synthetase-like protein
MGLDPSRTPPSVQGLVQRFLRADELSKIPTINAIVDAVNLAAVEMMIPLGVFDARRVVGEIRVDLSQGGEYFHPIGADAATSLEPGVVILRDDEKVLSQFCHRDADAQKVTVNTQDVWLLGCQVAGVSADTVASSLSRAIELLRRDFQVESW